MAEDCLSLNVWTPAVDGGRRPVLVFLHGGGVVAGSGSAPLLDGRHLSARGDLVVVTLNFRLGALGSLLAPERLGDGDGDPTTNLALRDQLAALRWVRREIGAFGGDTGNVTVAGQSSGAVAIACMLAGDAATGCFDRAILQSGGLERVRSTAAAAAVADRFFAALGEPFDRTGVAVDAILAAQRTIPAGFVPPVGPFHHAVDGDVIPDHPLLAAAARPLLPVPVLAGTTRDEWRAFDTVLADEEVTEAFLRARVRALAGEHRAVDVEEVLDRYRAEHPLGDALEQRRAVGSALVTDFHFAAPTDQFVRAHAARGNPVHHYELQWESPRPGLGACHDMCLPLLFATMDRAPGLAGADEAAAAMSAVVQEAWIAFARSGDPSTGGTGPWPAHDGRHRPTMLLGATPRVVERHREDLLAVWQGRYPVTG
jgi:para-nitrobenzyl esterase